jgi:hypothetical protein
VKAQELVAVDTRWENDKVKKWLEKKNKPQPTTIERQLRCARREFTNLEKLRVRPHPYHPTPSAATRIRHRSPANKGLRGAVGLM